MVDRKGSRPDMLKALAIFGQNAYYTFAQTGLRPEKYKVVPLPMYLDSETATLYEYLNKREALDNV